MGRRCTLVCAHCDFNLLNTFLSGYCQIVSNVYSLPIPLSPYHSKFQWPSNPYSRGMMLSRYLIASIFLLDHVSLCHPLVSWCYAARADFIVVAFDRLCVVCIRMFPMCDWLMYCTEMYVGRGNASLLDSFVSYSRAGMRNTQ